MIQRLLIVEDEPPARRKLQRLLQAQLPEVEIYTAEDTEEASVHLSEHAIDGVFLDIHLPEETGLAFARLLQHGPPIIFVTAYREYAVDAFELRALDYLVKPVDPARLTLALERLETQEAPPLYTLRTDKGRRFVTPEQIVCVVAQGDYTEVWLEDGTSELVSIPMYEWEEKLKDGFERVHRSSLVRMDALSSLERTMTGAYTLKVRGVSEQLKISRKAARMLRLLGM